MSITVSVVHIPWLSSVVGYVSLANGFSAIDQSPPDGIGYVSRHALDFYWTGRIATGTDRAKRKKNRGGRAGFMHGSVLRH
ncbi:uncharacterized protein LY79DRAFT_544808 [Colletotrichum navitas]|uniref:Uncharacterized protein n=1 Tax=Colletotrichum navitas TaxID=681940 RepID=A0AAD8V8M2_9PEZI|nr:uncharacterized protein LY79DRAFT_544808 [Colletotrichum navitas]KAK1596433.1 hypothetical protein LY79DRAFT_544808 [Colletotrichum navitas]